MNRERPPRVAPVADGSPARPLNLPVPDGAVPVPPPHPASSPSNPAASPAPHAACPPTPPPAPPLAAARVSSVDRAAANRPEIGPDPVVPIPPPTDPAPALFTPPPTARPRRVRRSRWSSRMVQAATPRRRGRGPAAFLAAAPAWLISFLFHLMLLLVLGLVWLPGMRVNVLELSLKFAESLGEQLDVATVEIGADSNEIQEPVIAPEDLAEVSQPLLTPPPLSPAATGLGAVTELAAPDVGLALNGRQPGMKKVLLAAYGGNALTEQAVTDGLEWLKRNQRRDGTWSLAGPYSDGATVDNKTAATAMALLAFQGAGHTHQQGVYADVVKRGTDALLKMQGRDGDFWQGTTSHHRLYSQAQAMIAICELYGMTQDSQLRSAAERSVDYAVKIQDRLGGWRYQPGFDSDTSVSGWFMMGLQSARMAKLDVPSPTLERLSQYLDRAASPDGARYAYQPGSEPTHSMTAEALLCRQYLGWHRDDPRLRTGVNLLLAHPIDWNQRDVYYWYYATQVLHHLGGDAWEEWNRIMRTVLPENQTRTGRERGSWSPMGDRWGPHGGRLYVTCLSLYMLEVYYRHLPIYASMGEL